MKKNYPYTIGIDWLQLYCKMHRPIVESDLPDMKVKVKPFPTQQYWHKAEIYYKFCEMPNKPFCEILFDPRNTAIPEDACQLRVMNEPLYTTNFFTILQITCSHLNLEYISISRIDLFYDCNKFAYGVQPRKLIMKYLSQKVMKIGINRGTINFRDYGYQIPIGTHKEAIAIELKTPNVNAITWGQKDYIQTQLYNKTLELSTQKFKPYIWQLWQDNGLDPQNVWRTEIRISKAGKSLQLLESDSLFSLGLYEIKNAKMIEDTFCAYATKHFRFVKTDYHKKKQQMKPLELLCCLSDYQPTIKTKIAPAVTKSLNTIKSIKHTLEDIRETFSEVSTADKQDISYHLHCVIDYLSETFPLQGRGEYEHKRQKNKHYSKYIEICNILEQIKYELLESKDNLQKSKWDEAIILLNKHLLTRKS